MKYRILIKTVNVNIVSFNWFNGTAGNSPWETETEQEALQQYHELLKTNPHDNLTLVNVIPVDIEVSRSV